jgi:ribosomal peptide maturation radical SAM protein 1
MSAVLLISMPWAPRNYTPIRLGVLKAALEAEGLPCHTESLFLRFAERIGAELYDRIAMSSYAFAGEWLFNAALSPQAGDAYLDYLAECTRAEAKLLGEPGGSPFDCISDRAYRADLIRIRSEVVPLFLADTLKRLAGEDYDVVGFSCVVNQLVPSLVLAKAWKERRPETLIVFGGASVQAGMGEECLRAFPWVDAVADGEAEVSLPELVRFRRSGPDAEAWRRSAPHGLYIRASGKVVHTGEREPIRDFDPFPLPDYTDYFATVREMKQAAPANVFVQFEASRGCWWGQKSNCVFCGLNGRSIAYRAKSPARILLEMLALSGKHQASSLYAVDTVCGPHLYREALPKLTEAGYDLNLFCEVHPSLGREHLRAMREAGVRLIQPGIESFSSEILRLIRKGTDALRNIRFLRWCRELGIDARYNLLWGFPGEAAGTYRSMTSLVPALEHLAPPTYPPSRVVYQRFSPLTAAAAEEGLALEPQRDYQFVYPPGVDARKLAYAFEHPHPYPAADGIDYIRPLAIAIKEWRSRYYSLRRPTLLFTHGPGFAEVTDTRGAEAREFVLAGPAAAILVFCADIHSKMAIVGHVREQCGDLYGEEDVDAVLEELTADGLLYGEENRYVTLAIPQRALHREVCFAAQCPD